MAVKKKYDRNVLGRGLDTDKRQFQPDRGAHQHD